MSHHKIFCGAFFHFPIEERHSQTRDGVKNRFEIESHPRHSFFNFLGNVKDCPFIHSFMKNSLFVFFIENDISVHDLI